MAFPRVARQCRDGCSPDGGLLFNRFRCYRQTSCDYGAQTLLETVRSEIGSGKITVPPFLARVTPFR